MSWWQREQDADEVISSGRAAMAELHAAACRLNEFVAQLEELVADEQQRRQREKGKTDA